MLFIVSRKRCDSLAEVQPHVVAGRLHPVDVVGAQEEHAAARLHDQAIELLRLRLDVLHQRHQALAEVAGAAPLEVLARVLQRLLEAVAAERLQQVVDGVHFERLERVLVVGGDEHHRRHPVRRRRCWITPKPSHAGICTSRNTRSGCCCWIAEIGLLCRRRTHRSTSMSFSWLKQADDALARHRLVVHYHRANLGHATPSTARVLADPRPPAPQVGIGNAAPASPPSAGCRNSNRCSDPYRCSSRDRVFDSPTPRLKSVRAAPPTARRRCPARRAPAVRRRAARPDGDRARAWAAARCRA